MTTVENLTSQDKAELYNALGDRINVLHQSLAGDLEPRIRASLQASFDRCQKLVEVFE